MEKVKENLEFEQARLQALMEKNKAKFQQATEGLNMANRAIEDIGQQAKQQAHHLAMTKPEASKKTAELRQAQRDGEGVKAKWQALKDRLGLLQ